MSSVIWDPAQYGRYAEFRSRPFHELVRRVGAERPARIVDLGCGSGELTATLVERWPTARILGIDSSPEMLSRAPERPGLSFRQQRIEDYRPDPDLDVLVSNAALQWVPNHRDLLDAWLEALPPGAWVAVQVPANFRAPSHTLLHDLTARPRWSAGAAALRPDAVDEPEAYAQRLVRAGWWPDVWETTFVHALTGETPVLDWMRGTGLRPVLQALPEADRAEFESVYGAALDEAYPAVNGVTLLTYRRIFLVGHKPA